MADRANTPAFPHPPVVCNDKFQHDGENGMTLREYAAIQAMQGILANPAVNAYDDTIEHLAIKQADALLAALQEK